MVLAALRIKTDDLEYVEKTSLFGVKYGYYIKQ